jgi:four helix bundle protein
MGESLIKIYDLEERTFRFAKTVSDYIRVLPKTLSNAEYSKQLLKSSASIGANYIEANESLGKKDFSMRIKISRKEAKETAYWLRLIIETNNDKLFGKGKELHNEAIELKKILSSILLKSK